MKDAITKCFFKIAAALLAYLPMLVVTLDFSSNQPATSVIARACLLFNFPPLSLVMLINPRDGNATLILGGILMFCWATLFAWLFWKAVGTMQGEDEAEAQRGKFDWAGFRVRFVIGFIFGSLIGWRFVAKTTSAHTLLTASLVTAVICGLAYGLSRPPDFWSRP